MEEVIGKPLSPYAVTKYVNELYADVFSRLYNLEIIGLRYFNVFGMRQDPDGDYAAVIPNFVKSLENVIQANQLVAIVDNPEAVNTVYNIAFGERTSLYELIDYLKEFLSDYDKTIKDVVVNYGPERVGDVPHSLASIDKAKNLLGYHPEYSVKEGLRKAIDWYWKNLK